MNTYAVIYERATDGSWAVRAADLPVFTVGDTREEAEENIREAIASHLEVLAESGESIPPTGAIEVGTVAA